MYGDQTAIGGGYQIAPQLFYFAPQRLWYLIYQAGNNAGYSTNSDITNPYGSSATKYLYSSEPSIVSSNGSGWRSQTTVANFPNGMGNTVIAASDPTSTSTASTRDPVEHVPDPVKTPYAEQ